MSVTLCNPIDVSPPGSSVPGILQAKRLEWAAVPFSRGPSPSRDRTGVPFNCRQILYHLGHQGSPQVSFKYALLPHLGNPTFSKSWKAWGQHAIFRPSGVLRWNVVAGESQPSALLRGDLSIPMWNPSLLTPQLHPYRRQTANHQTQGRGPQGPWEWDQWGGNSWAPGPRGWAGRPVASSAAWEGLDGARAGPSKD